MVRKSARSVNISWLSADNHEILTLLADFLTKEAESETLALPEIQDDPRVTSNPNKLSRDEFNTLPQDIQDKFTQVEQLIDQANLADEVLTTVAEKTKQFRGIAFGADEDTIFQEQFNQALVWIAGDPGIILNFR